MSVEKRAGQFIGGVISNPTFILYFVVAVILFVIGIRFIRKDKREAKARAKVEQDRIRDVIEREETVYPQASNAFGLSEESVKICDDIAFKINGALGFNDNEEIIIRQLNRLAGPKSIKCADFFFKSYRKGKTPPNIAFDAIDTLNYFEWNKVKEDLKQHLLSHARLKGEPSIDLYFFDGKQLLHSHKTIG